MIFIYMKTNKKLEKKEERSFRGDATFFLVTAEGTLSVCQRRHTMYIYIYTIYLFTYIFIYTLYCVYLYIYIYIYVYVYLYILRYCIYTYIYTSIHLCMAYRSVIFVQLVWGLVAARIYIHVTSLDDAIS